MDEVYALQATGTDNAGALKQAVAERIALHRSRRAAFQQEAQQQEAQQQEAQQAAARREEVRTLTQKAAQRAERGGGRVRDAVAARYQNTQSYRDFLAAEAERALQQAQAEAEVAARKARAVADAQLELLAELEQWNKPEPGPREQALEERRSEARGDLAAALADIALGARELMREATAEPAGALTEMPVIPEPTAKPSRAARKAEPVTEVSSGGLTVKLYDELGPALATPTDLKLGSRPAATVAGEELQELEDELEFRRAPEFGPAQILESTPIPGNLIEFPRQLIAPKKARPRIAEGPLRDEAAAEPQLRIFEVEADQIGTEPELEAVVAPGWQSLQLEATHEVPFAPHADAQLQFTLQPQIASLSRRLAATGVDAGCVLGAFAAFAVAAQKLGAHLLVMPRPMLGAAAAGVLLSLYLGFELLFFTLSNATPGMRAARIALCTFGDDNPSRRTMRRRVLLTLLAASPLGLGIAWSLLDDERLGWHDRMSRTYQRAY